MDPFFPGPPLGLSEGSLWLSAVEDEMDEEEKEEEASRPSLTIPEDLDSREAMVVFFNAALASAEEEKARLRRQLREQQTHCRRLAHLEATSQSEPTEQALVPRSGDNCVSGESTQALQMAMEKLQVRAFPNRGSVDTGQFPPES